MAEGTSNVYGVHELVAMFDVTPSCFGRTFPAGIGGRAQPAPMRTDAYRLRPPALAESRETVWRSSMASRKVVRVEERQAVSESIRGAARDDAVKRHRMKISAVVPRSQTEARMLRLGSCCRWIYTNCEVEIS